MGFGSRGFLRFSGFFRFGGRGLRFGGGFLGFGCRFGRDYNILVLSGYGVSLRKEEGGYYENEIFFHKKSVLVLTGKLISLYN